MVHWRSIGACSVVACVCVWLAWLHCGHDSLTVLEMLRLNKRLDCVVVAGAWRLPDGSLSRAFKQRLLTGAALSMFGRAKKLILTGGRNDSIVALDFLDEQNPALLLQWFTSVWGVEPPTGLRDAVSRHITMRDLWDAHVVGTVVLYENVSTTTESNAVEAQKLLGSSSTGEVVVVSSPYHLRRCRILFSQHVIGGVLTFGSPSTELEWVLPPHPLFVRHVPHNTSSLVMLLTSACKSARITYNHWAAHLRTTFLSFPVYGALREFGAFVVNLHRGTMSVHNLVHG